MLKVALFLEGQTDQILTRRIIELNADLSTTSFDCFHLHRKKESPAPYCHQPPSGEVRKHFLLLSVGNDESVLSTLLERMPILLSKGYTQFIALRDMYSLSYKKRSPSAIDNSLNLQFIEEANKSVRAHSIDNISIHFAIMEIEAWFLGMPSVLKRINNKFNLEDQDPESSYFHPSKSLNPLFGKSGYNKSKDQVEKICSHIEIEDLDNLYNSDKCESFRKYYKEMRSLL